MATVQELMKLGEQMNLTGADLEFVREQQILAREEREKERAEKEKERDEKERERIDREKDRQFEMERLKLMEVSKRLELQAKLEDPRDRSHVLGEDDVDQEDQEAIFGLPSFTDHTARGPKMTAFDEKDDMGSYLHRFERYAELQRWMKDDWAVYLAALLKGKALV